MSCVFKGLWDCTGLRVRRRTELKYRAGKRPNLVPEILRGVVLLGLGWLGWSKVPETKFSRLVVPCVSSHWMKFSCGVWNEPLVPHVRKGWRSPPGLIVPVPVEEFGSFHKLWGVAVSGACSTWKNNVLPSCDHSNVWHCSLYLASKTCKPSKHSEILIKEIWHQKV